MSRFFTGGGSSSEEEDEFSGSEEEDQQENNNNNKPEKPQEAQPVEEEEEELEIEKRVVRSARDRRYDEINSIVGNIRNAIKISDWKGIENEFEKLNKSYSKAIQIIQKEGNPKQYIAVLAELDDFTKETHEKKTKLNAANQKSFQSMRQKLKKHNKNFEADIEKYRQNPNAEEEEIVEVKAVKPTDEPSDEVKDDKTDADKKTEKEPEKKPTEMTSDQVRAKLKEILLERGKRNTDPMKQVEKFMELYPFAKEAELQIEILVHTVSAQFDITRNISTNMSITLWKSTFQNLMKILDLLEANSTLTLHESDEPEQAELDVEDEAKLVGGNLMAFVERIDDEFTKSLQSTDPHTQEYVQRLQEEGSFIDLAERAQTYYEKIRKSKRAARIAARRVEHIYYKFEGDVTATKRDTKAILERLTNLIYQHGDERLKTRTILCHIYYHALHGRFYEARDMMLMSHLQESILHMDVSTQILFNRTMVQLGLCAFRCNLIKQAHSCLSEMYASGRVKELLAQGVTNTRHQEKNPEQEKLDRRRQLPFHMHVNLELLEAIHLICALLLEVPNMAMNAYDPKKKIISRTFRRLLDFYDRQVFTGPPENTRDIIITASKALARGDWKKCEHLLLNLNVWNLLQNSDSVKAMLKSKIQEEGLRTYLFTYGVHYDSISLSQLTQMFELKETAIHQIISKMMINEEIHASWDQPTNCIIMHKGVDPTRLQYLALQFSEKAAQFVENNERLLDTRTGSYGYKFDNKPQKEGHSFVNPMQRRNDYQQNQQNQQNQQRKRQGNKKGSQQQNQNFQNQNYQQNQQRRNRNSLDSQ